MAQMSQNRPKQQAIPQGLPPSLAGLNPSLGGPGMNSASNNIQGQDQPNIDMGNSMRSAAMTQANPFLPLMQQLGALKGPVNVGSLAGGDDSMAQDDVDPLSVQGLARGGKQQPKQVTAPMAGPAPTNGSY